MRLTTKSWPGEISNFASSYSDDFVVCKVLSCRNRLALVCFRICCVANSSSRNPLYQCMHLGYQFRDLEGLRNNVVLPYMLVHGTHCYHCQMNWLTIPASCAMVICSWRAFAVTYCTCQFMRPSKGVIQPTAITGTGLVSLPCFCQSLILRMHVKPSITAGKKKLVSLSPHYQLGLAYLAFRDP
jgi:hypothetical protein